MTHLHLLMDDPDLEQPERSSCLNELAIPIPVGPVLQSMQLVCRLG